MKKKITKLLRKPLWGNWISKLERVLTLDYSPVILPWFKFQNGKETIDYIHRLALIIDKPSQPRKIIFFTVFWPIMAFVQATLSVHKYGSFIREQYSISYFVQWQQIIYLAITHNISSKSYYKFRLWNELNRKKVNLYIQHREIVVLLPWLNKSSDTKRFKDKTIFYEICLAHKIPTASIIAAFSKDNDIKWFCDKQEIPAQNIFIKNSELGEGIGAEKWKYCAEGEYWKRHGEKLNQTDFIKYFRLRSRKMSLIVQPCLQNHSKIEGFSNGSLCTLRIVTYRLPDQKPMPLISSWRMPVGNGEADNFAYGGIAAGVSVTGTLGLAVGKNFQQGTFSHHPDTQSPIEGEQLPFWEDMVNLALLAHERFENPCFIGWDIALTTEGPILIEGNTTWCVELLQMPHDKPLGETAFVDIFSTAVSQKM
jgi:hypothetical protein